MKLRSDIIILLKRLNACEKYVYCSLECAFSFLLLNVLISLQIDLARLPRTSYASDHDVYGSCAAPSRIGTPGLLQVIFIKYLFIQFKFLKNPSAQCCTVKLYLSMADRTGVRNYWLEKISEKYHLVVCDAVQSGRGLGTETQVTKPSSNHDFFHFIFLFSLTIL